MTTRKTTKPEPVPNPICEGFAAIRDTQPIATVSRLALDPAASVITEYVEAIHAAAHAQDRTDAG